ncbi:hypothetical protein DFH09DRAFT_1086881 [Mycena vulgaris]|nr:hypothetical protein DFH09DRAFT_1086881 [Mycena vulgaris]
MRGRGVTRGWRWTPDESPQWPTTDAVWRHERGTRQGIRKSEKASNPNETKRTSMGHAVRIAAHGGRRTGGRHRYGSIPRCTGLTPDAFLSGAVLPVAACAPSVASMRASRLALRRRLGVGSATGASIQGLVDHIAIVMAKSGTAGADIVE